MERTVCSICKVTKTSRPSGTCFKCSQIKPKVETSKCLLCDNQTRSKTKICTKHSRIDSDKLVRMEYKPIQTTKEIVEECIRRLQKIKETELNPSPFDAGEQEAKKEIVKMLDELSLSEKTKEKGKEKAPVSDDESTTSGVYEVESEF